MGLVFVNKLNMKALNFSLSFLLLIVFVSCYKQCYRELSDEEKSRLGFKPGEKIIFKSNLNQFDTLEINSEINRYIYSREEKCTNEKHNYSLGGIFKKKALYSII